VFQASPMERAALLDTLLSTCWVSGDVERARKAGEEIVALLDSTSLRGNASLINSYCWLLAETGEGRRALELLDRTLRAPATGPHAWAVPEILLPRAQLHIALNEWGEAEKDVAEFLRLYAARPNMYNQFGVACIMQGFLLERRGDTAGALAVWRRGRIKVWRRDAPREWVDYVDAVPNIGALLPDLILASLTDDFTDADRDVLLARTRGVLGTDTPFSRAIEVYVPPTSVFRLAYQSPRGREAARRYAFRQAPLQQWLLLPPVALVAQYLQQNALLAVPSAEQEDLMWQTLNDTFVLFIQSKFTPGHLLQLGVAWRGQAGVLGWEGVKGSLPEQIRGPLAYFLGCRYARVLNRPKDAEKMFQTAHADAKPDSPLRKLAQAELDRLKEGK